jgi:hypothetical protein
MPADKLILLSKNVTSTFECAVKTKGHPKGNYSRCLDLRTTTYALPVRLYCGGSFDGANKIEFIQVATLGLSRVEQIVREICGNLLEPTIYRVDWAVDLLGISLWDLAACCRVSGIQSSRFYHSRGGDSFYPHFSPGRAILIYEKLKRLRAEDDPLAKVFRGDDELTRIEVQFRSKGVPIKEFVHIRCYADIDLLKGVGFLELQPLRSNLKPQQRLAAERLRSMVQELGLQNASKRFSPSEWSYVSKTYFEPGSKAIIPNIPALMQKSAREWLEDRIRFPR